jgi:hypothetical protein
VRSATTGIGSQRLVCLWKLSPIARRQRRGAGNGCALVDADGQVSPGRLDRHVPVVAKGVDRPTQDLSLGRRGPGPTGSLVRRHAGCLSRGLRRWAVAAGWQRIPGESPPKGMSPIPVPRREERHHRRPKFRGRVETPRAQTLPPQGAEEQLDLVHPGGVFRRVVQTKSSPTGRDHGTRGMQEAEIVLAGTRRLGHGSREARAPHGTRERAWGGLGAEEPRGGPRVEAGGAPGPRTARPTSPGTGYTWPPCPWAIHSGRTVRRAPSR